MTRILLTLFALLFSTYSVAAWYIQGTGQAYSTSAQACSAYASTYNATVKEQNTRSDGNLECVVWADNKPEGQKVAIMIQGPDQATCPATGQPRFFTFPAGTSVQTQACVPQGSGYCVYTGSGTPVLNVGGGDQGVTLYSKSATPASSCQPLFNGECDPNDPYAGCYTPPNDGCTRQPNGSIVCPDQTPPPTPEPKCNYNSTNSYCTPEGGQCPKGFVPGTSNGQTICVKNSHDEPNCPKDNYGNYNCAGDPNQPPTNPPNNQQGDGSCNGTGNCSPNSNNTTNNTYNNTTNNNTTNNITNNEAPKVDFSGVIAKLEEVKTGIAAVDASVKGLATAVKAVEDAVNTSSQKITAAVDKTTSAVKDGFTAMGEKLGVLDKSVKDGTAQAKADAEKQLKATEDQTKQDKDFQDWQKAVQNCNPTIATAPETNPGGFIGGDGQPGSPINHPTNNYKNVNGKLCQFADSFEDYKKWIKGEGKDSNGNPNGIPDGTPNGAVSVGQTTLSDAGLTGAETETDYIKFTASCPADYTFDFSLFGQSKSIGFSYKPLCDIAPYIRIINIIMAYISGAFIVLGIGRTSSGG